MRFTKMLLLAVMYTGSTYADGFNVSMGADYSSGKYGTNDSTYVTYMPFIATYQTGALTYRVTVPWVRVRGVGDVVPSSIGGSSVTSTVTTSSVVCTPDNRGSNSGSGSSGSGSSGSGKVEDNVCTTVTSTSSTTTSTPGSTTFKRRRTTESGLGDIVASLGYNVLDTEDWAVDLTGRIKFATADEDKGLGSGENDYAVQVNVDKYFGAPYVSVGLGYRWLGEPRGVDFRNVTYGSVGAGYKVGKGDIGVSYDWATSAVKNGAKPQGLALYGAYWLSDAYKLSGEIYTGLSNANPDIGGGLTLAYYF